MQPSDALDARGTSEGVAKPILTAERTEGRVTLRTSHRHVRWWWTLGGLALVGAVTAQLGVDGGWLRGMGIAATTVGVVMSSLLALGTSGERETRGVLTRARRLDIVRSQQGGYRAAPGEATLKADRRQWPLHDVRAVVHGHADSYHSVYVVLPSEVLWVVLSARADAVREAARLVADELGREVQYLEHPPWQAQSWAPVALVFGSLTTAIMSLWQLAESFSGRAFGPPALVAVVAILAPVTFSWVVTIFTGPRIRAVARTFVDEHLATGG